MDTGEWADQQAEFFRDKIEMKEEGTARLAFLNIRGIPFVNDHPENEEIQSLV